MKEKSQSTPGFTTSVKTRPLLVSKLDIYTREKACIKRYLSVDFGQLYLFSHAWLRLAQLNSSQFVTQRLLHEVGPKLEWQRPLLDHTSG